MILSQTDLVAPLGEVLWTPESGYHIIWALDDNALDEHRKIRSCLLWEMGCFCMRYHSAYFQERNCWAPPTPIFLASRRLKDEAQEVFLKGNRFVVLPSWPMTGLTGALPKRLPVNMFFLEHMPGNALCHLRSLEIVFEPLNMTKDLHSAFKDFCLWNDMIEYMRQHLLLSRITLTIHIADICPYTARFIHERDHVPQDVCDRVIDSYYAVFDPIKTLKRDGLRSLFIYLAHPKRFEIIESSDNDNDWPELVELAQSKKRDLERELEERVMGSEYNAVARGKGKYAMSQWLLRTQHIEEMDDPVYWRGDTYIGT